jgi:hypothetical protein
MGPLAFSAGDDLEPIGPAWETCLSILQGAAMSNFEYKTDPLDEMEDVVGVFYGGRGQVGQQFVVTNRRLLIGPLDVGMDQVLKLGIVATRATMSRDPKNNAVRDRAVEVIRSAVQSAKAAPPKPV